MSFQYPKDHCQLSLEVLQHLNLLHEVNLQFCEFQIDTVFYLEQINQRIIVSLIFLTVYFLGVLLFFYISYRIAIRKIKKLSTDI